MIHGGIEEDVLEGIHHFSQRTYCTGKREKALRIKEASPTSAVSPPN
jgi:hypothetical protein